MHRRVRKSTFFFWGKRTYAQGSHVMEEFLLSLKEWRMGALGTLTALFFTPTRTQGTFVLYDSKESMATERAKLSALLQGKVDGKDIFVGLMPGDEPITQIVPDDEASLLTNVEVDPEAMEVRLFLGGRDRLLTYMVALNKHLLKTVLASEGYTPWVLGRLRFNFGAFQTGGELTICLKNNVGNLMTRSKVFWDKTEVGEIQFTRSRI